MDAMKKTLFLLALLPTAAFASPAFEASDEEIRALFAQMDSDRDGQVSQGEFEKGLRQPHGASRDGVVYQRLPARFRVLDADADGYLDAEEYVRLGIGWRGAGPVPAFAEADRSGDAKVDFREFAALHAPRTDAAEETAAR
jgi:Ca2+-binding EF-hand superfamily protein